jgi:16S rRNA processing protein RimM
MSNTQRQERLTVAKVVGLHGLQGFVKVKLFCESFDSFVAMKMLWATEQEVEAEKLHASKDSAKQLTIEKAKIQGRSVVVKFKEIEDRTAAEALGKVFLSVSAESLPELPMDEYYWHQLIGLEVYNADGLLGVVDCLLETGSNDVLVVKPNADSMDDVERLLPYRPEVVQSIGLEQRLIKVDWDSDFENNRSV